MYLETNALAGLGSAAAFGAVASPRPAVGKLQTSLRLFATQTSNADYFPGRVDNGYGLNTHAALVRVARDFLVPLGALDARCVSTCNSLHLGSRSFCGDCIRQILRLVGGHEEMAIGSASTLVDLTDAEIEQIVSAYGEWLAAYVAEMGGGEVTATDLVDTGIASGGVPDLETAAGDAPVDQTSGGDLELPPPPAPEAAKRAGMPWWGWLLLIGTATAIGAAIWKGYHDRKLERERRSMLPS